MSECSEQQQNNAPSNMSAASPAQAADEMATSNNTETVTSEPLSSKLNADQSSPNTDNKKAAAKRTPSKRLSFIERAQKESEELVRNMGGSLELEGGRRTRSSTRGTPTRAVVVGTPPPSKKARNSPSSGAATPIRARGKGRKLDTTIDTDDETNTTAPAKKENPLKMKRGETERKVEQQDVIKEEEEEEEGKSENKADNNVQKTPPVEKVDKNVKDVEAMPVTQSTEDEPDAVLDPVPEETESQTNDDLLDKSQLEVNSQEQSTVAVEQKLPPSSAALTNETETEQKLEVTTTATTATPANKTKTVDLTEEEEEVKHEEEETTTTKNIPKIMDCMTNDVEPMEVDSSSKSNDAVEIIESDNNSTEMVKAKTISYETPKVIDKSLENVVVLNAVAEVKTKEPSDNPVPDTNTNTSITNAIIIDNKAVGDSEMMDVLEMNNCTSLNEHKTNNIDKDLSETEMVETSAPAITAPNNTNATTPSI